MARTPTSVHLVCREDTQNGFTQHPDPNGNVFTTSSWRMSDAAAESVTTLYLHDRKSDVSWAQGTVIDRRKVTVAKGFRWEFDVRAETIPSEWPPGQTGGGPEKAYV